MTAAAAPPLFSVILATRNRPHLFATALQSILEQSFGAFEVIVVNDGSSEEHIPGYRALLDAAPPHVRVFHLVRRDRGHGQSYALNFGVGEALGTYVCFLDDDDQWTDPEHLGRAANVIAVSGGAVDLLLCNQKAFRDGVPVDRVVWIEDLEARLPGGPDAAGAYTVSVPQLLRCQGHCHLNTTIVSRAFYLKLGGLDEGLRYECDADFFLRAIDRAGLIRFLPPVVSRHNIPDPAAQASMTTIETELSKRLYQLRVLDKAVLLSGRPEIRRYAMRNRAYTLQHIAAEAARSGWLDCAAYYARQAAMARLSPGSLTMATRIALLQVSAALGGRKPDHLRQGEARTGQ